MVLIRHQFKQRVLISSIRNNWHLVMLLDSSVIVKYITFKLNHFCYCFFSQKLFWKSLTFCFNQKELMGTYTPKIKLAIHKSLCLQKVKILRFFEFARLLAHEFAGHLICTGYSQVNEFIIPFKMFRVHPFTELLFPIYKIMLSEFFFTKVFRKSYIP